MVVSNTRPLLALTHLNELHLLHQAVGSPILIPPAVAREFGRSLPDWIGIRTPNQPIGPQILAAALGDGESEALALALELKPI